MEITYANQQKVTSEERLKGDFCDVIANVTLFFMRKKMTTIQKNENI
jgi:hypothetical protein